MAIKLTIVGEDNTKSAFNSALGSVNKLGQAALTAAAGGLAALGAGLGAVAVQGVRAAADLEAQMSGVQAVLGATAAEMDQLNDLTLALGIDPNLKVSTVEAAEAMEMLARNGLSVEEILEGAAHSTVLLANATGGDFAQSADIMTDAMALWGIEAANAAEAVDGITSVVNNSKFSIDDYALALAQGGGVAASVGVEFEDFNATIAAISPLFASGSDAGTSLKTMLQRLVPQTDKAADAFSELGLITRDTDLAMQQLRSMGIEPASGSWGDLSEQLHTAFIETNNLVAGTEDAEGAFQDWLKETRIMRNAFFDANGELKSMADIQSILFESTKDLTEEQRNQAFATLFGTDAMRAAFGMTNLTNEEFRALQQTMSETSAVEGAAIRMDNLAGAMEIARGIVEGFTIQLGQRLLPYVRQAVEAFQVFATNYGPMAVDAFMGLVEGAIALAQYLALVVTDGDTLNDWLTHLPESVRPVVQSFGEWVVILQAFATDHSQAFIGAIYGIAAAITAAAIASLLLAILNPINLIIIAAGLLGAAWATNFLGIQEKTAAAWAILQPIFQQVVAWLQTNIPVAVQATANFWNNVLYPALQAAWSFIQNSVIPIFQDVANTILPLVDSAIQLTADNWNNVGLPALRATWEFVQNSLIPLFEALSELLSVALTLAIEVASGAWNNIFLPALQVVWAFIQNSLLPIFEPLREWLNDKIPTYAQAASNALAGFKSALDAIAGAISTVIGWINNLIDKLASIEVPAILQQHSPSPLEQSLLSVASAAAAANSEMGSLGRSVRALPSPSFGVGMGSPFATPMPYSASGTASGGTYQTSHNNEYHFHYATPMPVIGEIEALRLLAPVGS